jgi:formylglycine-generating enzyme required for sulfatase activity
MYRVKTLPFALAVVISAATLLWVGYSPLAADITTPAKEVQTNSIGMKFVLIPAGTFMMGSPQDEAGRKDDETLHKVTISEPFYLQSTEVTQGQWKRVMGNNPSKFTECGDDCPVEDVSWVDAQKFIEKLNKMEGKNTYRLPTEAEWEYACRAGSSVAFYTGTCISTKQANYKGEYPHADCPEGIMRMTTTKVGTLPANSWGLYDMLGNVWEWTNDWYGDYPTGHVTDPKGPSSGKYRVIRGGSWQSKATYMRSAYRAKITPDSEHAHNIGFRVAKDH